jgi:DNA-binding MarR family transcriptional regulator
VQKIEEKAKELGDQIHNLVHHFILKQHSSNAALCSDNLSKQEVRVIETLGKKSPCIMSELADNIMLAVSTLTGIVDNLVNKKLVRRERSEEDRRIVRVKLTPKGKDVYLAHEENHMQMSFGLLNALDELEQELLLQLFRKINNKIQEEQTIKICI